MSERRHRVVGFMGGSGVGKMYNVEKGLSILKEEGFAIRTVPAITTRPNRGAEEDKHTVSPDLYKKLLDSGKLVGHHPNDPENPKYYYAYEVDRLKEAAPTIFEINPQTGLNILDDLKDEGFDVVGVIGMVSSDEFRITNIGMRQPDMPEGELSNRLQLSAKFENIIRNLADTGIITHLLEFDESVREKTHIMFAQALRDSFGLKS